MSCPCGTGRPYQACCGPFHAGQSPDSPEQLMRARYAAFARCDWGYLSRTQVQPFEAPGPQVVWVGLTVHRAEGDEVEFTARYLDGEAEVALRERSKFVRADDGRWRYARGSPTVATTRLGRNQPCPCGSGKKLKACHGGR